MSTIDLCNEVKSYSQDLSKAWDCQNPSCNGWLKVYREEGTKRMAFVVCSNKENPLKPCKQIYMFSKMTTSVCRACGKEIREVIKLLIKL